MFQGTVENYINLLESKNMQQKIFFKFKWVKEIGGKKKTGEETYFTADES